MLTGKNLRAYLSYAVHGNKSPSPWKKAPQLARKSAPKKQRGKPRKGPPRDKPYRQWIATLPCISCGCEHQSEPAHTGTDGGMRMKASDYSCIPLCPACHRTGPHAYHAKDGGKARLEARIGRPCAVVAEELRARYLAEHK